MCVRVKSGLKRGGLAFGRNGGRGCLRAVAAVVCGVQVRENEGRFWVRTCGAERRKKARSGLFLTKTGVCIIFCACGKILSGV